jgi:hypothetical protein
MPRKAALLSPIKEAGALKYLLNNVKMARRAKATLLTKARRHHPQSIKWSQTRSRHADFALQTSIPRSQMKLLGENGRCVRDVRNSVPFGTANYLNQRLLIGWQQYAGCAAIQR